MKYYQGWFQQSFRGQLEVSGIKIKKSGSPSRSGQMWRKEPRSELNYSIQNLKGFVNKFKRILTSRIRNLRRMPDETRQLLLINWQRRQKRLSTYVIWCAPQNNTKTARNTVAARTYFKDASQQNPKGKSQIDPSREKKARQT